MSEPTRCVCVCHCHAGWGKAENPGCPITAKDGGMCSECRGECRGQSEPRLPSRDELAKALQRDFAVHSTDCQQRRDPAVRDEDFHCICGKAQVDAALREGGER